MRDTQLPPFAAWRFVGVVDGFEVLYPDGRHLRGHTSAVEDGRPYAVHYDITVDDEWRTREVRVSTDVVGGPRSRVLVSDGRGRWSIDGEAAAHLDGLVDVDLEASACTNMLPVHRMEMPVGEVVAASAVYVQALDLEVRRLDQTYRRRDERSFDYTSEGGFAALLTYDPAGLVTDYPGIATRFA
ncbi:hypothetical protein HN031_13650 [Nocardioides sp. zg-1308]|uniref:Glycolipid-binding domain-containing protein n=1 Tax=Nocardioides renjunii TaxID=3095075 RepID=A0ABU5KCA1_9ACTN|nr:MULTISPECIES: putative glycolipid-binding domain-containing protein [unclassified Nocardioides]MDZ5662598.1 putative glycolipid-binding domain-containing protein [Nocardioides sp. S-58]NPD05730.1 hypothetical protein [Nocardioides sp. zg-1308]